MVCGNLFIFWVKIYPFYTDWGTRKQLLLQQFQALFNKISHGILSNQEKTEKIKSINPAFYLLFSLLMVIGLSFADSLFYYCFFVGASRRIGCKSVKKIVVCYGCNQNYIYTINKLIKKRLCLKG
jgi:hypothetical protein